MDLSEYDGWQPDDLREEIEALQEEVDDIAAQIATEDQVGGRGDEWRHRAIVALKHRKQTISALKRRIHPKDDAIVSLQAQLSALRQQNHELNQQLYSKNVKLQKIAAAERRQNHTVQALKGWVARAFPDRKIEAYAVIDAAQEQFDNARALAIQTIEKDT